MKPGSSLQLNNPEVYVTSDILGLVLTCDAKEKLGPGDLFLLGAGGALFAAPPD
jgi:hypothetical protein